MYFIGASIDKREEGSTGIASAGCWVVGAIGVNPLSYLGCELAGVEHGSIQHESVLPFVGGRGYEAAVVAVWLSCPVCFAGLAGVATPANFQACLTFHCT